MSILELIKKIFIFVLVIPALAMLGSAWSVLVMTVAVLLAPVVCVYTLFTKEPYTSFAEFYTAMLLLASVPFIMIEKLINP